ncbi:MAG: HEAT repeat domain-containing protein [Spirochaetaceae bacterium]|nr:HEAT repeat domain-containing protein [Spirochaetaceae bacterium]
MKQWICVFLIFALVAGTVFSQEAEEKEKEASQFEQRQEKILFGLETEIVELIDKVIEEEDFEYGDDFYTLFNKTRSNSVRTKIIGYFEKTKDDRLKDFAAELLEDPFEENKEIVNAVFSYVSQVPVPQALEPLRVLLESEDETFQIQTVKTLGKIGTEEDAQNLRKFLDKEIQPGVKQAVIDALGDLGTSDSWDSLCEIVNDKAEDTYMRMHAVESLGKIDSDKAAGILVSLYDDKDANFRVSVIKGLATSSDPEAQAVLIEALQDSYFRVRLEALEAIKNQKLSAAFKSLLYRAKNDSENVVKYKAYETLAALGEKDGLDYLVSLVKSDKQTETTRGKAATALLKYAFGETLNPVIAAAESTLNDEKQKKVRYALGKEFAKYESAALEDICLKYLENSDVATKGTGLDIYAKNAFPALTKKVEEIAKNEKEGANQKKAKYILEKLERAGRIVRSTTTE